MLRFASFNKAIQHLSDISELRIIISTEEDKEYYDVLKKYYNNDEDLVNIIKEGEESAKQGFFGSEIKTEKSDSGNTYIRYIEKGNKIGILGMISKTGRLVKGDVKNLKSWMSRLLEKIKDGYQVFVSANNFSKPIINRIIKMAEKDGENIFVESAGGFSYNGINWENMIFMKQ